LGGFGELFFCLWGSFGEYLGVLQLTALLVTHSLKSGD